jgi:SAM-dependent methyltransferase
MNTPPTYLDYVGDRAHMEGYSAYQQRYATQVRESDKVLIGLVGDLKRQHYADRPAALLDVGCSTGNLLLHLKRLVPGLNLCGGDLATDVLANCRTNPQLAGIRFEEMNVLELPRGAFDIVTANVMLFVLGDDEFDAALTSIAGALKAGGWLLAFDYFHPFRQELTILEKSEFFPAGLPLHVRGYARVGAALDRAGFARPDFLPFDIPIDLERPRDAEGSLNSYTVPTADGRRLCFRGVLCQPWCHLVVRKGD